MLRTVNTQRVPHTANEPGKPGSTPPNWRGNCRAQHQGGQGAGGGLAEGAQRREEGGEEDVNPLIGFAMEMKAYAQDRVTRGFL